MRHPDPWTQIQLVQHFGKEGKTLLDWGALLTARELTVRAATLDFWVENAPRAAIKKQSAKIVKLLGDPHYGVTRLTALVLAWLQDKSAIPALRKLLKHPACPMRNLRWQGPDRPAGRLVQAQYTA